MIEMRKVFFSYKAEDEIQVSDLNIEIKAGEFVLLCEIWELFKFKSSSKFLLESSLLSELLPKFALFLGLLFLRYSLSFSLWSSLKF